MIPILWRYLLRNYFQVFLLCASAFIAILLVTRFQDIARFAALGSPLPAVLLFTFYQIPYILVYAIPISCLVAALLLFQKMSHSFEMTAIRASGVSLRALVFPVLFAGGLLTLFNLTVVSEITPRCRALSKELIYSISASNPLTLFQKDSLVGIQGAYADIKTLQMGKCAKDVILVVHDSAHEHLALMTAKELTLDKDRLYGSQVCFVTSVGAPQGGFDHLVIENQTSMSTEAASLSPFIEKKRWNLSADYLTLRELLAKEVVKRNLSFLSLDHGHLEVAKRLTLGFAAFTFTLIGVAFGMDIGRRRTKKGLIWAVSLATVFMICFLGAKSMRHALLVPCLLYLLPHPIIIACCLFSLKRTGEGVE